MNIFIGLLFKCWQNCLCVNFKIAFPFCVHTKRITTLLNIPVENRRFVREAFFSMAFSYTALTQWDLTENKTCLPFVLFDRISFIS